MPNNRRSCSKGLRMPFPALPEIFPMWVCGLTPFFGLESMIGLKTLSMILRTEPCRSCSFIFQLGAKNIF
jgi:hypothetical protein